MAVRVNQDKISVVRNMPDVEVKVNQSRLVVVRSTESTSRVSMNWIEVVRSNAVVSANKVTTAIITL